MHDRFHAKRAPRCALLSFRFSFVCLFALAAPAAWGEMVSITAAADTFVLSQQPANNYGAAGALPVSDDVAPRGAAEAWLRFDLAGTRTAFDSALGAGQWRLEEATLTLTATTPNNPLFNPSSPAMLSVSHLASDDWVEGTGSPQNPSLSGLTWNSRGGFLSPGDSPAGTLAFDGGTSGQRTIALAADAGLDDDALAGALASLRITAQGGSGVFNTRNFGTQSARPTLMLRAERIPEPGTAGGLAALAILALWARVRR